MHKIMDLKDFKITKSIERSGRKLADVFTDLPKTSLLPVKYVKTGTEKMIQTGTAVIPQKIRSGAEAIPQKLKSGAEAIPKAIKTGAEAIPQKLKSGAEAIPQAIKTGAEAIPQKLKSGAEAIPRKISESITWILPEKKDGTVAKTTGGTAAAALAEKDTTALAESRQAEQGMTDTGSNSIPPEIREKLKRRRVAEYRRRLIKTTFKKKLAKGSAGTVLGLSIMLAGLFDSPADLIQQQTISHLNNPEAIEIMIDEEDIGSDEDERKQAETTPTKRSFLKKIADSVKNFITGLPQWVKTCVCIPLWGAGYGITYLLSLLYTTVLSPILSHIIGFVLLAAALLTAFAVTMKCLFPNMPLKKILNKKNITTVLISALVLKALDIILPFFWLEYYRYKHLIMIIAGIVFLLVIVNAVCRRRRKKRKKHQNYLSDNSRKDEAADSAGYAREDEITDPVRYVWKDETADSAEYSWEEESDPAG